MSPNQPTQTKENQWNGLYRVGGAAILIAVLITLTDMAISFSGGDNALGMPVTEWFALFAGNPFVGLRNLGLFNILTNALTIPLFLALFAAHRRTQPAAAALAVITLLFGAAVYTANNQALPMLALSEQYASAAGKAQRELIAAAGTALLARGEDFTPGSFPGFFFCLLANGLMGVVLLRGKVFRKWIAITGLVGALTMLVFTAATTFRLASLEAMMGLALIGGLCAITWNVATALRLFRLAKSGSGEGAARQPAAVRMETSGEGAH